VWGVFSLEELWKTELSKHAHLGHAGDGRKNVDGKARQFPLQRALQNISKSAMGAVSL
jgi:hypothetical protein